VRLCDSDADWRRFLLLLLLLLLLATVRRARVCRTTFSVVRWSRHRRRSQQTGTWREGTSTRAKVCTPISTL